MYSNKHGFTLIEILVWVSISIIVMLWVGVFVTSGMKNITLQKTMLQQDDEYISLFEDLGDIFLRNFEILFSSSSGILVKRDFNFGKWLLYDIGVKTMTWECENDENIQTKYLQITNYNPFFISESEYSGSSLQHQIFSGGQVIIWNKLGKYGETFVSWWSGTGIFLNNPAGITQGEGKVFVSDSGNNRILYLSGGRMYSLLDYIHGMYMPTGILYDDNKLFILNSWRKELLQLSSTWGSIQPINITFTPSNNISDVKKLQIKVLDNFQIMGLYSTGSFSFSWFSIDDEDTVFSSNTQIIYTFTGIQNLYSWTTYNIEIPTFTGSFWWYGSYYVELSLLNSSNGKIYEKYLPYTVHSDNDITTLQDNTFMSLTGWLNWFFSDISLSGSHLVLKDYLSGTFLELSKTGDFIWTGTITIPEFEKNIKKYDIKIRDIEITKAWKILTFKIEYYKHFSCLNEDENIVRTFLLKKTIPD